MKAVKARVTCNVCGRHTSAVGYGKEDALALLAHYHACDHGHYFEGEVKYKTIEREGR